MSAVVWERRECVSAEVEGALVLLDLDTLLYHSLNGTAAAVWGLLAEPRSADQIVSSLCDKYNVSADHCQKSVDKLLGDFAEKTLVKPRAAEPRAAQAN